MTQNQCAKTKEKRQKQKKKLKNQKNETMTSSSTTASMLEISDIKNKTSDVAEKLLEKISDVDGKKINEHSISPNKKLKISDGATSPTPSGKPRLEGAAFVELKRHLREKTDKIRQMPKFRLHERGKAAQITKIAPPTTAEDSTHLIDHALSISDIQHLLLYSQLGAHSPFSPAKWCQLEKYNNLSNVVVFIVENVNLTDYLAENRRNFKFLNANFTSQIALTQSVNLIKELSLVPLTSTQIRRFINEHGTLAAAHRNCPNQIIEICHFPTIKNVKKADITTTTENDRIDGKSTRDKFDRTKLLLSPWQMIEENFPLPLKGLTARKYPDYKLTKRQYVKVTADSPMLAVDCEMCRTEPGDLELTRVSIVNEQHAVIYDTLVKPQHRIIDYLTRFSGINRRMLENVTKRLTDVQNDIDKLLPPDVILIGQSLTNDLHALKLMHPYIIDTSIIFNTSGQRMCKTKLKDLAREFLKVNIQQTSSSSSSSVKKTKKQLGHDSCEDSLACMKLVQLKLQKSVNFGDAVMSRKMPLWQQLIDSSVNNNNNINNDSSSHRYVTSLFQQCVKQSEGYNVKILALDSVVKSEYNNNNNDVEDFVGNKDDKVKLHSIMTDDNEDVVKEMCKAASSTAQSSVILTHVKVKDALEKTSKVDNWVKALFECAQNDSLLIVLFNDARREGADAAGFIQIKQNERFFNT